MRIMLIAVNDISAHTSLGVINKLEGEFLAFQKSGNDVFFLTNSGGKVVLRHNGASEIIAPKERIQYLTVNKLYKVAPYVCKKHNIDLCYIRFPLADCFFMQMLKKLKKIAMVYMEIPTYPYDEENKKNKNIISKIHYFEDRFFRRFWKKYIRKIITFSNDKIIFGVPCINISNGIDVEKIKYIGDEIEYGETIHLISVALIKPAHGYDRVIEGLKCYYESNISRRVVKYSVVGNGSELPRLQKMVKDYHLEEFVTFYGTQYGESLDNLFRNSEIGIAVLAGHRQGMTAFSDLKSREYCARGIPFIFATEDKSFPENVAFRFKVPLNDEPIEINRIIEFADLMRQNPMIHREMRDYAESYLTWEMQMQTVLVSAQVDLGAI